MTAEEKDHDAPAANGLGLDLSRPPGVTLSFAAVQRKASERSGNQSELVLIVDDNPTNLSVLVYLLTDAQYRVAVADSGEMALELLRAERPDLILLDVMMPAGMDGFETCRRIKVEAGCAEVPVLFLTALSEMGDKMRGFKAGAVDYIIKPLHPAEVLARVRVHLQIRSLQRALEAQNELLGQAVAQRLEAEAQLQQSLDRAVVVAKADGRILFSTRLANLLLLRYYPDLVTRDTGLPPHLPGPVKCWVDQRLACPDAPGAVFPPVAGPAGAAALTSEVPGGRLSVHLFRDTTRGDCFMLLLEEKVLAPAPSPAGLLVLGLTAREAEVLFWIAQGKTGPEVAVILEAAPGTIKKHVQNILLKLGVETRLAAALRATEVLGLNAEPGHVARLNRVKESGNEG